MTAGCRISATGVNCGTDVFSFSSSLFLTEDETGVLMHRVSLDEKSEQSSIECPVLDSCMRQTEDGKTVIRECVSGDR